MTRDGIDHAIIQTATEGNGKGKGGEPGRQFSRQIREAVDPVSVLGNARANDICGGHLCTESEDASAMVARQAMATSQNTIDFILDQLAALTKIRARKMFGEYALYCDERVVALVCDDQLFVKITKPGQAFVGESYAEGIPYPGAKPALLVSADDLEDDERLCALIRLTATALPAPKPKKRCVQI